MIPNIWFSVNESRRDFTTTASQILWAVEAMKKARLRIIEKRAEAARELTPMPLTT